MKIIRDLSEMIEDELEGAEEDFIIDIECFDSYSKDSISYYF